MTIHAAKGLEFPITIVSGMSAAPRRAAQPGRGALPPRRRPGRLPHRARTSSPRSSRRRKPIDEQMGYDERIRLLYVACTRACDHLVVSLHRAERDEPARARTAAAPTPSSCSPAWASGSTTCPTSAATPTPAAAGPGRRPVAAAAVRRRGQAERDAALAVGGPARRGGGHRAHRRGRPRRRRRHPLTTARTDAVRRPWPRTRTRPPGCRSARATSTCRRGSRAATAPRWAGPCTACCRRSTSPPATASTPRSPPSARPRPSPTGPTTCAALVDAALGSPVVRAAAAAPALARGLRLHPDRRPAARGLRRPALPRPRRPGGRRPQDRRHRRPRTSSTGGCEGYRLQGAAYALAVGAGHRRAGRPGRRSCSSPPTAPSSASSPDLAAAMADVERLVRRRRRAGPRLSRCGPTSRPARSPRASTPAAAPVVGRVVAVAGHQREADHERPVERLRPAHRRSQHPHVGRHSSPS